MPRSSGPEVAVWADGVSVTFAGGVRALASVSVAFRAGEFTVLLGRSGAGKSTLLRCLNGLVRPHAGAIRVPRLGTVAINGAADAASLRAHCRATAMIFQSHQLIGRHTALKNVLVGRLPFHSTWRSLMPLPIRDRLIALACLERVGLLDKALARTDRLSGGQQQRVGVARALAQEPTLVLADEPVASLDPATARAVLSLLREVCDEGGLTAVVSLHQVELARQFADRVIGLADGAVSFDGPPEALDARQSFAIYGGHTPTTQPANKEAYA